MFIGTIWANTPHVELVVDVAEEVDIETVSRFLGREGVRGVIRSALPPCADTFQMVASAVK